MADDFSELYQLSKDLGDAADASKFVRGAVEVTSNKIKKDARASVKGRKHFGQAFAAIDYDLDESPNGVESEIGYDKGHPVGPLGNLLEFGAPNAPKMMNVRGARGAWKTVPVPGGGKEPLPPSHDLGNALLNNESDFEYGLSRAIDDALKRSGL